MAVVDVETTGLDPEASRVVECAIVTCSGVGDVVDEWSSLISVPGAEEIGASWLHGITRSALSGSPTFPEVAGEIATRLRGSILVGHVVEFDELARAYLAPGSRTLAAVCARLGIARTDAHTALGDARVTASVMAAFAKRGIILGWSDKMKRADELVWPTSRIGDSLGARALAHGRSR